MLKELTKKYVEAFDSKDLDRCAQLFTDEFALEDPVVKRIEGKIEANTETAQRLLAMGLSAEQVAEATQLPLDIIEKLSRS